MNENKEIAKRLQESEAELKQAEISLKRKEEEKRKELDVLKEHFQKKLDEKKGDSNSLAELERQKVQWQQEKHFLQEQLSFFQKQIEENKVMHEALMAAINQKSQNKEQDDKQIIQINKSLSETIAQVEARN